MLVDGHWKLIGSPRPELYDTENDPGEQHDLATERRSVAAAMSSRADAIFGAGRSAPAAVSAESAERLRALGYVAPAPTSDRPAPDLPNPRDAIALWNQLEGALPLMAAGRSTNALPLLRALSKQAPDARVFHSTLAQALKDSGRTREALQVLRRLAARWPDDPTVFHDLAVAARETGEIAEAMRAEQAALVLDADAPNALNGLGLLHADAGRPREAAAAFEKAAAGDPNNASFWTNLGNARRALGDLRGAEQAYRRALETDARLRRCRQRHRRSPRPAAAGVRGAALVRARDRGGPRLTGSAIEPRDCLPGER